jgi:hypothetical protein
MSEGRFTEDSEGNKGWNWACNPLRYLRFLLFDSPHVRGKFYRRQQREQRFLAPSSEKTPFATFVSFCSILFFLPEMKTFVVFVSSA